MKKKERKYLNKKDINTNFLGTIISYKRILVNVNLLIWNLVITNSKWANASYSAYGQTKSGKFSYENSLVRNCESHNYFAIFIILISFEILSYFYV